MRITGQVPAVDGFIGLRNYRMLELSSIYGSEKLQEVRAILGYMGLRNYRRLQLSSVIWVWETTWGYSYPRIYGSGKLHEVTAILGCIGLKKSG